MRFILALVAAMFLVACGSQQPQPSEPMVSGAWIRTAPPTAAVVAGYMTLSNPTNQAIKVIAASSDRFERVEFHHMRMEGSTMVMKQMESVDAPANQKAVLQPGEDHLMLIGPAQPVRTGERIMINLTVALEDGSEQQMPVTFLVRERATQ